MIASGVYTITNLENGKVYIGSTNDFRRRWWEHNESLRHGDHCNPYLQRAWNKYGEDAFKFMICEYVDNPEQLISREQYWLDFHRMYVDVYNIILIVGRTSGMMGKTHTKETRLKMSESAKARPPVSEETKRRIAEGNRGKVVSDETRRKQSVSQKGKKQPEETRQRISRTLMGHKVSEETRHRISESQKGKILSEEHRQKMSEAKRGNKNALGYRHTKEARRKMSDARKGKKYGPMSEEHKQKISRSKEKSYPAFINKVTGEIIPAGINLLALCRKRGFTNGIYEVKNGKCRSYRGWILA